MTFFSLSGELGFEPPMSQFLFFFIFLVLVSLRMLHPHTPSMTRSLSCSMFPLFTFVLCWLDLDRPNSSDPWYLVLALAFHGNEQICGSMRSLSLPFSAHSTLTFLPIWQTPQRSVQCTFLPANYHTASTTLPPVSTNTHLCTIVWLSFDCFSVI